MAIVVRRYVDTGPGNDDFIRYVNMATPPTVNTQYPRVTIDVNVDNAVPGLIDALDEYMDSLGLMPSATASPKQVLRYVATGAEGAIVTIGAAQGFVARVTDHYTVQATLCRPASNAIKEVTIINGSITAVSFDVEMSAPLEADDQLFLTIEDFT